MGYTHYWEMKAIKGQSVSLEKAYQRAMRDCQRVAKAYQAKADSESRLSGYTAHCKLGQYGGVNLNGKGVLAHETFVLREHLNQNDGFAFCKTARKPYDVVVTACLAILKHRLGDAVTVSSDGNAQDWIAGLKLARKVTGLAIGNPIAKSKLKLAA